jgi:hypothetical protein
VFALSVAVGAALAVVQPDMDGLSGVLTIHSNRSARSAPRPASRPVYSQKPLWTGLLVSAAAPQAAR